MFDIVDENTKRNQKFIVEVNKKKVSDNFNAIDLSQDTNIRNTFDAEFETNFPPDDKCYALIGHEIWCLF